jgi:nicotinate phosphoribosyltransferase
MTLFDHQRLTHATLRLDLEGIRRGFYSDRYFENVEQVLRGASAEGYRYGMGDVRPLVGDLEVEAQVFTRRAPYALVAGLDVALALLRHATGTLHGDGWRDSSAELEVEAAEDGVIVAYDGHPEDVLPVLRVRGRYRDFALLETPILGYLTRMSRVATNTYEALKAANGKPLLFFPARFDLPEVQAADGYAYWVAVQRYNAEFGAQVTPFVSTDAQGAWWGGRGVGTIPHALIAAFMGDTAEATAAFARHIPVETPRIALVDFNNDCVGDSLKTASAFWNEYRRALEASDTRGMRRWTLNGVRLDTSPNVRDVSLPESEPGGVTPALVRVVRDALDQAWRGWDVPAGLEEVARAFCAGIRIVVTGGFNRDRIAQFEAAGAPVNTYGVGSSLFRNDKATNTDFTMDVVRVKVDGEWRDMAKIGRRANPNPDLKPVDLERL